MGLHRVIIDTETTGFNPRVNKIWEVAAIKVNGKNEIIDEYTQLINPGVVVPARIQKLTGIDPRVLKDKPSFESIKPHLLKFIDHNILFAYNAEFDKRFLSRAGLEFKSMVYIDYLQHVKKLRPSLNSYKLSEVCRVFNIEIDAHRALNAVKAIHGISRYLSYPI